MSELHTIGWYAKRISPHLPRKAFQPAPERLWGGLAYLLLAVGGIGAIALYDLPLWGNLAAAFVIGNSFAGLGFLGHEILHGTVVRKPWLRDLLGGICFLQFSLGPKLWRKWHNVEHHGNTQDEDHDPDAWATMEELYKRPFLRWLYLLPPWVRSVINFTSFTLFFTVHSFLMLVRFYPQFKRKDRVKVLLQYLVPTAMWIALLVAVGPYKWLFAYLLPLMLANFLVICYISTNHHLNPLVEVNDPLANSLSVTVPRWVDVLHFNFSYHTEHHLFPGMNPKWGPLVKHHVKRMWPERYHEMPMLEALKALWNTPRIYHNHTDLVDPHRALGYGSLGHNLSPGRPHRVQLPPSPGKKAEAEVAPVQSLCQDPIQGD